MFMLRVVELLLILLLGGVLLEADITPKDWEFWALLAIVFCYGVVKYLTGRAAV